MIGGAILVALGLYGVRLIWHGFSTADQPSFLETVVARTARNLSIPRKARLEKNPWTSTADVLKEARESFVDRCAVCHGPDGSGQTQVGNNLYPKVPDLRSPRTQRLTDGEIRYIIRNGVRLTGMPGWAKPHDEQSDDSWKLVLFIRGLGLPSKEQQREAGVHGKFGSLRRIAIVREVSRANLRTLAKDADGECGARSAGTSRGDHS